MVKEVQVEGYDAFMKAVGDNTGNVIFAYFSGSKSADGKSWCPDCVTAEPVVRKCIKSLPEDAVFIYCGVGQREFWKDQSNIFRKDPKLRLTCVPTLLKWGTPQRLGDSDCAKKDLVQLMFEED